MTAVTDADLAGSVAPAGTGLWSARSGGLLAETVAEYSARGGWDFTLAPRIRRLLESLDGREQARYRIQGTFSLPEQQMSEPIVVRRALAFALVLREMPTYILDDELLVGGRTVYGEPRARASEVFPGFVGNPSITYFPTYATEEEEREAGMPGGAASNHNTIGYQRVLALGLRGLREMASQSLAEYRDESASAGLAQADRARRVAFLRAVDICLAALSDLARRYSALAGDLAGRTAEPIRRRELLEAARVCGKVAEEEPETFHEALQLYLFTRIASMVESYGCMPLGRFDQHLWPFLEGDLAAGRLDRAGARELLECLFVKLNQEIDVSSTDDCLRIMVGGQTPAGEDATNELTFMCLESAARLRLPSPKIGVRLHRASPPRLLRHVVETIKLGIAGLPEIYNDESVIPATVRFGVSLEDARDYCHDGCAEITIGGKSDFYPTWTNVRHLRVFAETLDAAPEDISWPDLLARYKDGVRAAIARAVERGNTRDRALGEISPAPFMSATLEGCIESGLDKTWGGCKYNMTGLLGSELVNAANALAAVRQIVFEEGDVSLGELRRVLASDFAGLAGERLRLRLRNRAPKFGNDDERVDGLAAEIASVFIEEGQRQTNPRGGRFCPGFYDFAGYVTNVRTLGATPDGRRAGESVSGHLAPVGGTDRNGVTANLRSMSRITSLHPPMGTMFDIKLQPAVIRGAEGTEKLQALVQAFLALEGKALQFNVVDAATLRAAQANPEAFRNLLVRVWGFSAYFVELSADFQEHIINRTEHAL